MFNILKNYLFILLMIGSFSSFVPAMESAKSPDDEARLSSVEQEIEEYRCVYPDMDNLRCLFETPEKFLQHLQKTFKDTYRIKPLTLFDLRKLYQLQQEHHELVKDNPGLDNPELDLDRSITDFQLKVGEIYQDQSIVESHELISLIVREDILQFVLFRPKKPNGILIIHTHGGPTVRFEQNTPHADIAYYVSNGYTVVCPNYIGSDGVSGLTGNLTMRRVTKVGFDYVVNDSGVADLVLKCTRKENASKDFNLERSKSKATLDHLPYFALRDLYVVMSHVKQRDGSGFSQVFLRGGSYGSCMNSNFITRLATLGCEKRILGVHLSGGAKYPCASQVPMDIPLLITHGAQDDIAYAENAVRFAAQLLYRGHPNVQVFISEHGDHHLMVSTKKLEELSDKEQKEFEEALTTYAEMGANFVNSLAAGQVHKINAEETLTKLEAMFLLLKDQEIHEENLLKKIERRKKLLQTLAQLPIPLSIGTQNPTIPMTFVGPTMAHLRLVLGDRYMPDVKSNLTCFLKFFAPIEWKVTNEGEPIKGAGEIALEDQTLFNQLVQMIWVEEQYLTDHPGSLVFYHVAPEHAMRLYVWLNLWMNFLQGKQTDNLETMRFFASHLDCFETIDEFLEFMRNQWKNRPADQQDSSRVFNNQKGFASRVLSAQPYLTGSKHNSASSSLYWYLHPSSHGRAEIYSRKVIGKLFKALGIYSHARVERMMEIFVLDRSEGLTAGHPQAVMQQIFMKAALADKRAYLCQMWGVELEEKEKNFSKPSSILGFANDPVDYERYLRLNGEAFTNPEGLSSAILPSAALPERLNAPNGEENASTLYADLLQARVQLKTRDPRHVVSYYRNPEQAKKLMGCLWEEIRWDITDFVLRGHGLAHELFPGCEAVLRDLHMDMGMPTDGGYSSYVYNHMFRIMGGEQSLVHGPFGKMKKAKIDELKESFRGAFGQNSMPRILLEATFPSKEGGTYFNYERYLQADSRGRIGVWMRPEVSPTLSVQGRKDDVLLKSHDINGFRYLNLLALAANKILVDPNDYAFFMDAVYAFRKSSSGKRKYMDIKSYRRFMELCWKIHEPRLFLRNPSAIDAAERSLGEAICIIKKEAHDAAEDYNWDFRKNPDAKKGCPHDETGSGDEKLQGDPFD